MCTGEGDALYTQEVACDASPMFHAHARHTIILAPGDTVAQQLSGSGGGEEEALVFEVSGTEPHLQAWLAAEHCSSMSCP